MLTFEEYKLGETSEELQIDTSEQHRLAATRMAEQSYRTIDIISRDLDPRIYDDADFVDAMKNMILKHRHTKVRILVFESQKIVRRGHRILELANNLSSFIELRKPDVTNKDFNETLFTADSTGYIHRIDADRFEGKLNFNDKRLTKALTQLFDEMWERAKPDPNLRTIRI